MIRKLACLVMILLFCLSAFSCQGGRSGAALPGSPLDGLSPREDSLGHPRESGFSMKGIWLSQFDLAQVYLKHQRQRPKEDFCARMEEILRSVKEMGFDTVMLQVHPYGDSFYPSDFFPPSRYVTGAYGRELSYDPLEVVASLCSRLSLSLHAWINPMRLMREEEILLLEEEHPLRRCYQEQTGEVCVWEGRCYLDPSYSRVREWIVSAAREICQRYEVAGVHMDDYFYPTQEESFDRLGYAAYREAGGELSLGDFRRESVSKLVAELYQGVKQTDPRKYFGISPAGNVQNVVECLYADVYRWGREAGFVDYLCPQLYYGFEHEKCPFAQSLQQWQELCQGAGVRLVVGLTLTKASLAEDPYAGTGRYEWADSHDVVMRSALLAAEAGVNGICVFSYSYLRDPLEGTVPSASALEAEGLLRILKDLSFSKE